MSELSNPNAYLLKDALSKEARDERRNLLVGSAIGIIVARTGLIPTKITTLGIEFNAANLSSLLWVVAIIVGYFWFAFLIYSFSDVFSWRITLRTTVDNYLEKRLAEIKEKSSKSIVKETSPLRFMFLLKTVRPMSWIRIIFECALPLVVGMTAIVLLLYHPVLPVLPVEPCK
jgi:hypothetical protein